MTRSSFSPAFTGSEAYSYDAAGRVTQLQKTVGATTYPIQYQYNAGGQVTRITYPSGRQLQQNVDNIGLLNTIVSGTTTYASIPDPPAGYTAAGQLLTFNYGNGVVANFGYSLSTRDQMTSLSYAKGGTTLFSLNYGYQNGQANCGTSTTTGNDGLIQCIQDTTDSGGPDNGRSVVYGHDPLNRLASAVTAGSSGYAKWGLSFAYDRYGNRTNQTVTAGSAPSNSLSFSTVSGGGAYTNRPDGYSFDVSGNMLNDGVNSNLNYDAENCLLTAGTGVYTCDAHGIRVKKVVGGTTTVYLFSGIKDIAEYDNGAAVGSPSREYIYLGGQLIATLQGSTAVYHHRDHLSVRVNTDANGNKIGEQGHFPYGEQWYTQNTTTKFIFTSYERDAESGNDYAIMRYYINRFGRFSCVDPLLGNVSDPQSLNRYIYVRDNPVNMVDPTGLGFFSWLLKAFRFLGEALTGLPHGPGMGGDPSVWSEQLPIYTGQPLDPRLIIQNLHDNGSGVWVADNPEEQAALTIRLDVWARFPSDDSGGNRSGGFGPGSMIIGWIRGAVSSPGYKSCVSNFYNSPDGQVTRFLAPTSLIPGWNPDAWGNLKNWAEAIGTKYAVTKIAVAGSNSGQMVNYSLTAGSATASASELTGVVGTVGAGLGKIAPPTMAVATASDILAHANCAVKSIMPGPINVDLSDLLP